VLVVRRLVFAPAAVEKLGARSISAADVVQLVANRAIVAANPRPRVPGSRWLIGPTDGGRLLTVVIEPTAEVGVWRVRTGWPSSTAQTTYYRKRRR